MINKTPEEKEYIFLDTNIFYKLHFNFEGALLKSIVEHAKAKRLYPLITNITISEIHHNVEKELKEISMQVKKIQKNCTAYLYFKEHDIFLDDHFNKCASNFREEFDFYIDKIFTVINVDNVKPSAIFDLYFSNEPPFSEKKRTEFKDAFMLEALSVYSKENNITIKIISSDGDMLHYCENNEKLVYFQSIESFLEDFCKRNYNFNIIEKSKLYVRRNIGTLKEEINSKLDAFDFKLADIYDGEIEDVFLEDISIKDFNIINIDNPQKVCIARILVLAKFDIRASVNDPSRIMQHDGEIIYLSMAHGNFPYVRAFSLEVKLNISSLDSISIEEVEIDEDIYTEEINIPEDFFYYNDDWKE